MRPDERNQTTCLSLEGDLSAYVDGELEGIQAENVISHLYECSHCQGFVEHIRDLAHLHRTCSNEEAVLQAFDEQEMLQNITFELLDDKIEKVADLFYQIGKAYLVKAFAAKRRIENSKLSKMRQYRVEARPLSLDSVKMKTGRLFREMDDLAKMSSTSNRRYKRAKLFFRSRGNLRADYMELGRRFMEECLAVDPNRAEPRLYLGAYFDVAARNYKKAREQFRRVLALPGVSEQYRAQAFINLGNMYVIEYRYAEALECFKDVAKSGVVKRYPQLFRGLIFLATTYAKLGDFEQSVRTFVETVKDYPKRVDEMRKALKSMRTFQNVVESQPSYRRHLEERLPVLFAS